MPDGGMIEPEITINGTKLSFAQAMTVRVAIEHFAIWISDLPTKERTGTFNNYMARIKEIQKFIFANQPKRDDGWRLGVGYIGAEKRRKR